MCMKVDCKECNKPTWKGCGKHIEQALKDVPEDERCKCPRETCESKAAVVKINEETKVETTSSEEVKSDSVNAEIKTDKAETKGDDKDKIEETKTDEAKVETKADDKDKTEETKIETTDHKEVNTEETKADEANAEETKANEVKVEETNTKED